MALVMGEPIDILILSNAPGEVMTWVRPVVKALRRVFTASQPRISVVLSPCPHASGQEASVLKSFPEVNRVQEASGFWPFLLWGNTLDAWNWFPKGVVLYLGGDQFYAVVLGKRLGYAIVTYAEWQARWLPWIDRCGLAQANLTAKIPQRWQQKVAVVGDLIAEAQVSEIGETPVRSILNLSEQQELVAILPGSKSTKLMMGVPLGLAIADYFQQHRPQVQCLFPVAPTLTLEDLALYADPDQNPAFSAMRGSRAKLVQPTAGLSYLLTEQGSQILLWQESPAYGLLSQCQLCLTTVGANTAELTALAAPMMVLIPTQMLEIIRAWDGIPGLLANNPLIGAIFARVFNTWLLKKGLGYRAWPNIWAKKEVVPELVGTLYGEDVAAQAITLLNSPERLLDMQSALSQLRGKPGAANELAALVQSALLEKYLI